MEPGDRPAKAVSGEDEPVEEGTGARRLRSALRLVATCVALTGLALAQTPGFIVADTKFDLAVAPEVFLSRAMHLWDPLAAGGQLQNQAYGYLWPMGPFFWVGHLLDVPGWAVQRLWLSVVICVAFLGAARLARVLGVRSDLACILGGLAYALSPRMLTVLGPISIEAWPSALAPWVLLPLVIGSQRGSPRRAAAFSAVAVSMVGGVNAVATFAVIPLGALWLLTRTRGPRRRSMMTWWPVFVLVGTAWWLVPLFVLGSYSPPFLDFIESAANTTFPTTLFDTLRGTSDWVPYVDRTSRGGNDLIRLFNLPLLSGVVLLLGLAGLLHPRNQHRLFLALGVMVGLLMVTAGHLGDVQGWGAPTLHSLLDGALAPLRNVHKFDPVVRLPLVLGLAWSVDLLWSGLRAQDGADATALELTARRASLRILMGTAVVAVVAASMPAFTGRVTPSAAVLSVPDYWTEAADWLAKSPEEGQALLVPGSSFGTYVWGSPRDEPMQYLARSRWGVRNAVPLTPPGNIRMLDAIEARLAQGKGSPGLSTYLGRAGISFLVVRNDLARVPDIPDPVLVHQAIGSSPGLQRVASFGPDVGGEAHLNRRGTRILINSGWQSKYPAVEIFAVSGTRGYAVQTPSPPTVVGGPEDLLDLADLGVLGDEPTVLASDTADDDRPGSVVLTDGLRAVERNFGRVHDGTSETRVRGQARRLPNPARDYLLPDPDRWSTTAFFTGAAGVTASSSMSDASALGVEQAGEQPYAAIDGHPETFWRANYRANEASWWQLDLEAPKPVGTIRVTAGPDDREVIRVQTDHASVDSVVIGAGATRDIPVDDPATKVVRILDDSGRAGNRLTLAEIDVPGVEVSRVLRLPRIPDGWGSPEAIVLRSVSDARRGCAEIDGDVRCVAGRDVSSEEEGEFHRQLQVPEAHSYTARMEATLREGAALARRVFQDQPVNLSASSTGTPDPRGSVLAAVDGDPSTTWTAESDDRQPVLTLSWVDLRRVSGLQVSVSADTSAQAPTEIALSWPGGRRTVRVRQDGKFSFPAIRTRQLTMRVLDSEPAQSLGFDSLSAPVPIGITELRVTGVPYLPVAIPTAPQSLPCGSGPTLSVDGRLQQTSAEVSFARLAAGESVEPKLCGSTQVSLRSGANDVDVVGSDLLVPRSVVLSTSPPLPGVTDLKSSGNLAPSERAVQPAPGGGLVVLRQNTNPGWKANQGGTELAPLVVDGWQQAWRVGPGDDSVALTFGPDRFYRGALLAGFLALGFLVLLTLLPLRWWRGKEAAPSAPGAWPAPVLAGVGLLVSGLLAGWPGLAVGAVTLVAAAVVRRRWSALAPWLLGALALPPAIAYALRPWGGEGAWAGGLAWPHYFVVAAVASLCLLPGGASSARTRFFRRRPGFSTKR